MLVHLLRLPRLLIDPLADLEDHVAFPEKIRADHQIAAGARDFIHLAHHAGRALHEFIALGVVFGDELIIEGIILIAQIFVFLDADVFAVLGIESLDSTTVGGALPLAFIVFIDIVQYRHLINPPIS